MSDYILETKRIIMISIYRISFFSLFLKSLFKGIFKPFEGVKIKGKLRVIFSIKMSGKCLKISYGEFTVISANTLNKQSKISQKT